MGLDDPRQGVVGDIAIGPIREILLQGRDPLGEPAGLDVPLAEHELGVGRGRVRRRLGDRVEDRGGPFRLIVGAIGEPEIIPARLGRGRAGTIGREAVAQ